LLAVTGAPRPTGGLVPKLGQLRNDLLLGLEGELQLLDLGAKKNELFV
jgi:hypothetical protein